ncbi:MAG: O-acetylserine/cysteine efflux transporter [Candidatus Azotimanducaceae bacterium]|jgi:O-acetylserine/cysteine efflux transporter
MTLYHQAAALLVTFIWGTNFVLIRYALDEIEPFTLAALRFLFVAFPLIFFLPKPKVQWRYIIAYGLLIGVGQFGLLFWAMQSDITPGLASLLIQLQVFFTILFTVISLKESVSLRQTSAMAISFVGLILVILNTNDMTTIVGVAIVLVAAMSWASGNLIIKHIGKVDSIAFLAWSSLFSIPPLVLTAFYLEGVNEVFVSMAQASWYAWATVLWQSIGNMLIGYGIWNILLHRYSAASVAPWALLVPVFGMSTSWLLLDEPMPWWKLLAMLLIVAGLALNIAGDLRKLAFGNK